MWVPKTAAELEEAARDGLLAERTRFEAKRQLPAKGKNLDVAIDVSAMTVDGGLIVYGLDEDGQKVPTVPAPIEDLAGAAHRIDQIVQTSIDEAPYVEIEALPLEDDPGHGYLVVVVPPSPRAPHQVAVAGEYRFYGRTETGNRLLSEGQVARLYERRQRSAVDRDEILNTVVAHAPQGPVDEFGYLHGFAWPVFRGEQIWERAAAKDGEDTLLDRLRVVAATAVTQRPHGYSVGEVRAWSRQGADAWALDSGADQSPRARRYLAINIDGRGQLFIGCAAATENLGNRAVDLIYDRAIAANSGKFLAVMAELYDAAGYVSPVDIGFAVTNIQSGVAAEWYERQQRGQFVFDFPKYTAPQFTRTTRISAGEMREPQALIDRLFRRLMDALVGPGFDPLADPKSK